MGYERWHTDGIVNERVLDLCLPIVSIYLYVCCPEISNCTWVLDWIVHMLIFELKATRIGREYSFFI